MGIICRGWTLFYFLASKNVPKKKKKEEKSTCLFDEACHLILVYKNSNKHDHNFSYKIHCLSWYVHQSLPN